MTLRQLVARWPNGKVLAHHLFVRRLGRSPSILERVISVPKHAFVAPTAVFSEYASRWLVPARMAPDRPDSETRALLGDGSACQKGPTVVNSGLREAILAAVAPVAFAAQGRRVERVQADYSKNK